MNALVESRRTEIARICAAHRVRRLEIFGSAAQGPFHTEDSDIDLLVEFQSGTDLGPWMAGYFNLKDELEKLFGRKVDLVMPSAMKNPYFIREVNRTRRAVYEG